MTLTPQYTVRVATWCDDRIALQALRREVFIIEQRVPESLEWDDTDAQCLHALAVDVQGQAIGTGRLLPDGHVGRMAVLQVWRRRGVGSAMLQLLIGCAREAGHAAVHLHAQTHAIDFYARHGFTVHGAEFMEAGIPHRQMSLNC